MECQYRYSQANAMPLTVPDTSEGIVTGAGEAKDGGQKETIQK
jgi:hypothetical protein